MKMDMSLNIKMKINMIIRMIMDHGPWTSSMDMNVNMIPNMNIYKVHGHVQTT
jgi:hypothetical protein